MYYVIIFYKQLFNILVVIVVLSDFQLENSLILPDFCPFMYEDFLLSPDPFTIESTLI
jgi:hypothetical protein